MSLRRDRTREHTTMDMSTSSLKNGIKMDFAPAYASKSRSFGVLDSRIVEDCQNTTL